MYLTITDGKMEQHHGVPSYETQSEAVGGLIEPVDIFGDDDGVVSVYVNEEGLLIGLPLTFYLKNAPRWGSGELFGNAIITRVDMSTGETVSLTDDDIQCIRFGDTAIMCMTREGVTALPTLEYYT